MSIFSTGLARGQVYHYLEKVVYLFVLFWSGYNFL